MNVQKKSWKQVILVTLSLSLNDFFSIFFKRNDGFQPSKHTIHTYIWCTQRSTFYSTFMTPWKCSIFIHVQSYGVCFLCHFLTSSFYYFPHIYTIYLVGSLICCPSIQLKIIFMIFKILFVFRVNGKIVKSISMAILWMVTALRAILGDGSCSLFSSLFSSPDI